MMLKVGDIVKSFDFNGIDTCYMVGKVVGVYERDGFFRAEMLKRVFDGQEAKKEKADYFTAPLQGNHFMDRADSPRVVVIA
jgi:hypothetical protein